MSLFFVLSDWLFEIHPVPIQTLYEWEVSMLTDTKLKNLKPAEKAYKVPDRDGRYATVTVGYSLGSPNTWIRLRDFANY